MSSLSRRLRRSVAAKATPGSVPGRSRALAWLTELARQARLPRDVLPAMLEAMPVAEVRQQIKARIRKLRAKEAAKDAVREPWVEVRPGVKISRRPRLPGGL